MDSHVFADSSSIHDTLWEKTTAFSLLVAVYSCDKTSPSSA